MSVEKIMNRSIVSVGLDDSLKTVKALFDEHKFHHLLVIEDGQVFGLLSDRDLLKAISPNIGNRSETQKDINTLNKKVHQIVTRKPITLAADASVYEAIHIFNENQISCIPIVDDEQRPVGMLSWRDILKFVESAKSQKKM